VFEDRPYLKWPTELRIDLFSKDGAKKFGSVEATTYVTSSGSIDVSINAIGCAYPHGIMQ